MLLLTFRPLYHYVVVQWSKSQQADKKLNEHEKNKDFTLEDLHPNIFLPPDDVIEEFDLEDEDTLQWCYAIYVHMFDLPNS